MRREIEEAFGISAVDIYGLSEVMGPGVAQEYGATQGWPDDLGGPFLSRDRRSREPARSLPDGSEGELVFTSLTKEAMPVVRYRTRDLTRLLPGLDRADAADGQDHGPLGRHADHPRRQHVSRARSRSRSCECPALAPHYLLEVARPGRLDELTVDVEARAGFAPEQAKQAADELRRHIKSVIGVSVRVNVCEPLSIERSTGKAVRVRDLR